MRNPMVWVAAVAALLVVAPAHAQNKCVDAKGKVIYQQDPCPGQVKVQPPPPQKPAAAAQKSEPRAADKAAKDGKAPAAKAAPKAAPRPAPKAAPKMTAAECERAAKRLEQQREEILKYKPEDRTEFWRDLSRAERDQREACAGKKK